MKRIVFGVIVIAACAHAPNLPLRPDPSPPEGSTTEVITAPDGTQLLARHWPAVVPDGTAAKAIVVVVHGLKDHSDRYAVLASELVAHGYGVYAFDLRGHGRSAGPRVAPDSWFDYVDDLDRFLTLVEQREPGKRVFVFAHSMGGEIAAIAAERHKPTIAGLLLSGPAIEVEAPPLLLAFTRLAAALNPKAPALALDNHDFSSDPHAAAIVDADPLVSQPSAPARTAAGLIEGMHVFWADIGALTMPILAMHGTIDRLTAPMGSRMLIELAPSTDKTLKIFPGLFHDLLHEPRGAEVRAEIIGWLEAHNGGVAMPVEPPYTGHLDGKPRGWMQSLQIALGAGKPSSELLGTQFDGRLAIDLAIPRPLGWSGSFTMRRLNGHESIALRPLGLALHVGGTALGVSAGGSILGGELVGGTHVALAAGAFLEQSAGPVHISLFGEYDKASGRDAFVDAGLALRFGGDREYWPHASAGVGPLVLAGLDREGDSYGWFVLVGLQLYGAD